jgi:hypothetical protein
MENPSLDDLISQRIVLDTQGALLYIGTLVRFDASGYWLTDVDLYDRNEGHSTKEVYLNDAYALERAGSRRVNRRKIFVERLTVASVSALEDVVSEDLMDENATWLGA